MIPHHARRPRWAVRFVGLLSSVCAAFLLAPPAHATGAFTASPVLSSFSSNGSFDLLVTYDRPGFVARVDAYMVGGSVGGECATNSTSCVITGIYGYDGEFTVQIVNDEPEETRPRRVMRVHQMDPDAYPLSAVGKATGSVTATLPTDSTEGVVVSAWPGGRQCGTWALNGARPGTSVCTITSLVPGKTYGVTASKVHQSRIDDSTGEPVLEWTWAGPVSAVAGADTTAPVVTAAAPSQFRLSSSSTFAYSATGGPTSYDVRWRAANFSTGFGTFQYATGWQGTTATAVSKTGLVRGYTYCFSVRARDAYGNTSSWSADKCTTVALDDRSLSGTGWLAKTGTGYFAGTYKATATQNRTLTRSTAQARRLALVATKCSTCGTVGVYVGSALVGKISLYSSTTKRAQIIALPAFAYKSGTIAVKVLSSGKTVQIDGLGISRI